MKTGRRGARLLPGVMRAIAGKPFTLISNNCWGAHVYQVMEVPYRTPFVGLFIPPEGYLTLVENFSDFIRAPLTFVQESRSPALNQWRKAERLTYPIGRLGGEVEINFQHYASEAEAAEKWRRRCERIVPDSARWFFKFDDRDDADAEQIEAFCGLPLANKVCFTATAYSCDTVVVAAEPGRAHVPDGVTLSKISPRYFNTMQWLSSLPSFVPVPALV